MNQNQHPLSQDIINKERWRDILQRFVEVLRINIFVVDGQGKVLLAPLVERYGGKLLTKQSLGLDFFRQEEGFIKQFVTQGKFLEAVHTYDLRSFAIPMVFDKNNLAYMVVGPVILNKRLEAPQYEDMAKKRKAKKEELLEELNGIRVVSYVMMDSILDLLSEIVKDTIELSIEKKKLAQCWSNQESLPKGMSEAAEEIFSTVRMDEILGTLLDIALNMTKTECGSIMFIDEGKGQLHIKASRGLEKDKIQNTRVKLGEGIAGLAARERRVFYIKKDKIDSRIKPLLKRPEIKESLIMPLIAKERVFGVLNLHTKKEECRLEDNLDNLQHLSRLISVAL